MIGFMSMICPICDQELSDKKFQIPFEIPYCNIMVCRDHVTSIGYETFLQQNADKLIEMYKNGEIKQENKHRK